MRLGFLSDAHGNEGALLAGLDALDRAGAERIFFLGDAVGYVPAAGVLRQLREKRIPCVRGNHEAMLLGILDGGDKEPVYRIGRVREELSREELEWVASWPVSRRWTEDDRRVLLVHGSPENPTTGYVHPDTDLSGLGGDGENVVVMGHTHRPFVRSRGETLFVNAGSCSMPRGGEKRGSAAVVDPENGTAEVLRYDIAESLSSILDAEEIHPVTRGALEKLVAR